MNRNKYILYAAPLLVVVLVVAFTSQIRKLQTQLRSSVRIVPAESKTRGDTNQNEIDQDATRLSRRPEVLVKFRAGVSEDVQSVDKLPGLRGKVSTAGRINAAWAVAR